MSFPFTYNKFLPVWLKNTNTITSSKSGGVSLYNEGKTELLQDASLLANVGVGKTPDASYSLDVSGNINFSNGLYKNGVLFDVGNVMTLTTTQTATGTKTMNDLRPTFSLNNTSIRMGLNSMGNQTADSSNNIAIGINALRGATTYGALSPANKNIVIGNNSCQSYNLGELNDNICIGHDVFQAAFVSSRQNVLIGSNVAKFQAVNYRNTFIGYNISSSSGSVGETSDCVVVGANSATSLGGRSQVTVVGAGNGSSQTIGNTWSIFGSINATSFLQGNRITILGSQNLININADAFSMALGVSNGSNQSTGFYNIYIGFNNNVASVSIINSATIGIACNIPRSHCLYLGASTADSITYQNLCIAFKNTLRCVLNHSTATLTIAFEDNETIVITSATTTTINLPTPDTAGGTIRNVGTYFNLLKSYTTPVSITINAPSGQTIRLQDGTTAASYTWAATEQYVQIGCIATTGTSWAIFGNSLISTSGFVTTGTAQSISGIKTFTANPVFNAGGIPTSAIASGFATTGTAQSISGIKTFTADPVFNAGAIPTSAIASGFATTGTAQSITGIKTFTTNPVFNTGAIPSQSIQDLSPRDTATQNTYFGYQTLNNKTITAAGSTAVGFTALSGGLGAVSGAFNVAYGDAALYGVSSGSHNVGIGISTNYYGNNALHNVAVGNFAGYNLGGNGATSAYSSYNTMLGNNCGSDTYGRELGLTSCVAIGYNCQIEPFMTGVSVIGANAIADPAIHVNNSVVLGKSGDQTYVMGGLDITGTTTGLKTATINSTGASGLTIGNSGMTLTLAGGSNNVNGELFVKNNTQKVNGISYLSGTTTLSTPLSQVYILETTSAGTINLPTITTNIQGTAITFLKVSTAAIWTINCGGADTLRFYKSNSTATATSITLDYTETILKIVATQSGVWAVLNADDMFYKFKTDFQLGRGYFPYEIIPTAITASTNWQSSVPTKWYGLNLFAPTANITITLPQSSNALVPNGMRLKFRRSGGTTTTTLGLIASTGDVVKAIGAATDTAAGTTAAFIASGVYFAEVWLSGTTWYCMT